MKILELCLRAFGPFTDFLLDFSGGNPDAPGGLHLIYGPNEAGKSTTRRALLGLLFGIPSRSTDNFLHDHQDLRVAARLRRADGTEFAFTRRKGNKQTLLDFAGAAPLPDENSLTRCLGATSEESFKTLFCLDHAELVRGGDDILQGKGDVGLALFDASLGGARLRTLLRDLDAEAEAFFKRKGSNQLIPAALGQYRETRERLRAATFTGADWQRSDQQKTQADAQRRELTAQRDAKRAERERLDRLAKAKPALNRRKQLREQLHGLGALPPLPDSFAADRAAAQADERSAIDEAEKRRRELEDVAAQSAKLEVRADLLEQAAGIAALGQDVRRFREDAAALPGWRGELAQLEAVVAGMAGELWPAQTAAAAANLRLTALQRESIRRLAAAHGVLSATEAAAREKLAEIEHGLTERRRALASLPPAPDFAALAGAVRGVSKRGDLDAALAQARQEQKTAEAAAARLLNALPPPWRGDLAAGKDPAETFDAPARLPVPLAESLGRFEQEFSALESRAGQLLRDAETCERETAEARRSLETLRRAGEVPTEADLTAARQRRDGQWQQVLSHWTDAAGSPPAQDAAESYLQTVAKTDELADRLRREADRVARNAELQTALDACERRSQRINAQRAEAQEALQRWRVRWRELWQATGLEPLSPAEMRSWLARHEKLCEAIALARKSQQAALLAQVRWEEARNELLIFLPATSADGGGRLEIMLERAQAQLDADSHLTVQREALVRDTATLESALGPAARKLQNAREELAVWQGSWSAALQPLALAQALSPEEAAGALDRIEILAERRQEAERLRDKLAQAEARMRTFAAGVQALLTRLRLDAALAGLTLDAAVGELARRLEQARAASQQRDALETRRQVAAAAREEAAAKAVNARQTLAHLCRAAGCDAPDALDAIEIRWKQANDIRLSLAEVEEQISHLSAGQPLETLEAEANALDADTLPIQLDALATEIQSLDTRINASVEEATRAGMELERFGNKADAIRAAEDAEHILARLREQAMQYARLRLAGAVLRREMERYRLENQNPLVRRAGEFFAAMTRGSFVGLCVDQDENDKAVLRGVRPGQSGGGAPVSGMSEGTCDQLYLALRLASLEKTLTAQEPLPLILDDILVNADDDRAGAMLRALHGFSSGAQVLLFTHHEHLLAVTERELGAGAFTSHHLPTRRLIPIVAAAAAVDAEANGTAEQLVLG